MDGNRALEAVVADAERAAAAGDYTSAERFLREAVTLQEATLGPVHRDLANTLNNLGVACESAGKLDEAEDSYRRAFAIAQAAFEPGHPFLTRSADNLRDFCEARGKPFLLSEAESPPVAPPPAPAELRADPAPAVNDLAPESAAPAPRLDLEPAVPSMEGRIERGPDLAAAPPPRSRSLSLSVLLAVAVLIVVWWLWPRAETLPPGGTAPAAPEVSDAPPAGPPGELATASPEADREGDATSPPTSSVASEPNADAADATTAPAVTTPRGPTTPAAAAPSAPALAPAPDVPVTVVLAEVCRDFSPTGATWRCEPVSGTTAPGRLAFYTRLAAPRDTTVEHRWYRDDTLVQNVPLQIRANPGAGYRTFSRNTVPAEREGRWRVELRSADGSLLREIQFVVGSP